MARFVPNNKIIVLDIATGTGDVLISLLRQRRIKMAVGIDMAENMLKRGKNKIGNYKDIFFIKSDAMKLPFKDKCFDIVTMAFGIRNMPDAVDSLKEAYRVLNDNGKIVILEFSLPNSVILRKIYFFYLRYLLPFTGRIISGDPYAYRYLNKTIESFPYGKEFAVIMQKVGLRDIVLYPQTFGVCMIYVGRKVGSIKGKRNNQG